jgi:hypothetical protein
MGLYDEIWWEAELPEGHTGQSRLFQTKSFNPCLDRYVVTKAGRLRLVGNGWQDEDPFTGQKEEQNAVDTDFHGDIRLTCREGDCREYMARFTYGTLEWMRPVADGPQSSIAAARRQLFGETGT